MTAVCLMCWVVFLSSFVHQARPPVKVDKVDEVDEVDEVVRAAQRAVQEGRLEEASTLLRNAIRLRPDGAYLRASLARLLQVEGRLTEALAEVERAIELDGAQPSLHVLRGSLFRVLENPALAEKAFQSALALDPTSGDAQLALADLYQSRREFEKSAELLRAYLEERPDEVEVLYFLGSVLSYQNKLAEAHAVLERVLQKAPGHARAWFRKAHIEAQAPATMTEAAKSYEKAVALDPGYGFAHYERGVLLGKLGRNDEAVAALERALVVEPHLTEASYALGTLLGRLGRSEEAQKYLDDFKRQRDREAEKGAREKRALSAFGRGRELLEQNRLEDALQSFLEMTELDPGAHQGYAFLAKAYRSLGQTAVAVGYVRRAMELSPGTAEYPYLLALFLRERGERAAALTASRRAVSLSPEDALLHTLMGLLLLSGGEVGEAVRAFEKAAEIDPKDPAYCLNLSAAYTRAGLTEKSAQALARYQSLTAR